MSKPSKLKEKYSPWAVVAGASEGLGAAFAHALAASGLNLILLARREEKLKQLSKELMDRYPVQVDPISLDLGDKKSVDLFLANEKREISLLV